MKIGGRLFLVFLAAGLVFLSCGEREAVLTPAEELERQGGQAYAEQNFEAAAEHYRNALQAGAETVRLHNNMGNAYFRDERYNAASQSYLKALKLDPEYLFAMNNLALSLYHAGEKKEAHKLIGEARNSFPNISFLPATNGYFLHLEGDRKGAVKAFERALEINPDSPAALNNLGALYLEESSPGKDPLPYFLRALENDDANKLFHDSLGWYYYKKGMFADATLEIGKAFLYDPRNVEVRVHYASVLEWIGKDRQALKQWKEILGLTEDSAIRKEALARSWEVRGRLAEVGE